MSQQAVAQGKSGGLGLGRYGLPESSRDLPGGKGLFPLEGRVA